MLTAGTSIDIRKSNCGRAYFTHYQRILFLKNYCRKLLHLWDCLSITDAVVLEQRLFADARSRVHGRRRPLSWTNQSSRLVLTIDEDRC